MAITYTQLCGMPRLERSSTAPEKREIFVIHTLTVAVKKADLTVGHIPMKISALCSLFLQRGGTIACSVTDSKRYSSDLSQGGLEIPCILKFKGEKLLVGKVQKLGNKMLTEQQKQTSVSGVTPLKGFEGKENQPCGKKPCSRRNQHITNDRCFKYHKRGETIRPSHVLCAETFKAAIPVYQWSAANCISDKDDNN